TFPFSVVAALLFFFNWEKHHSVLRHALLRRTGGMVVYGFVLVCAAAALAKPFLFTELFKNVANSVPQPLILLQWASIVDWLSFLFEIMFGIGVQIYLILMVYSWVRGLNFTTRHLMDFAIRRFSYVMKWTALGLLLSSLFINLPLILVNFPVVLQAAQSENLALQKHFHSLADYFGPETFFHFVDYVGRPVMAGFFILFSGMQIILTFHSESLVKAFKDYLHFLRKEAWSVAGWLFIAFFNFYILAVLNGAMKEGFAEDNGPAIAWSLIYPLLNAFIGGWMLASWVCLYKRSETGRVRDEHWVKY
ncbi:MAG TPA: hypothetical protein VG733_08290, partial [Chthoniobacteraceae bacterium]|nr:hypothetical protein [Chthoniobacteraceae bacterium]